MAGDMGKYEVNKTTEGSRKVYSTCVVIGNTKCIQLRTEEKTQSMLKGNHIVCK
jgi:hypothetical protein